MLTVVLTTCLSLNKIFIKGSWNICKQDKITAIMNNRCLDETI